MENSEAYRSAKERVEVKMGFYTHLSVYVAVILFLAVINFMTSAGTIVCLCVSRSVHRDRKDDRERNGQIPSASLTVFVVLIASRIGRV